MKKLCLMLVIITGLLARGPAQPGALDPGFMGAGTKIGREMDAAHAIFIQPDGRIVAGGIAVVQKDIPPIPNADFAIVRYNTKGDPDYSFGEWGRVYTDFNQQNDAVEAITGTPDGKILAAGHALDNGVRTFAVARYHSNGALDFSFGRGGKMQIPFFKASSLEANIVEQEDSRAFGIAVQPDGKIVLAGITRRSSMEDYDIGLMRLLPNGDLDIAFGSKGRVVTDLRLNVDDYANALALLPDGRILVAGAIDELKMRDIALACFMPNGELNVFFGEGGIVRTDLSKGQETAQAMLVQPDGKIVVAGSFSSPNGHDFGLVRYLPSGIGDPDFGAKGIVRTDLGGDASGQALAIQEDGRILVAGSANYGRGFDFMIVRYEPGGTVDRTYASADPFGDHIGVRTHFLGNDYAYCAALQPDGKTVVAGATERPTGGSYLAMARYLPGKASQVRFIDGLQGMRVYPNPTTGSAVLAYSLTQPKQLSVGLCDMKGVNIQDYMLSQYQPEGDYQLPLAMPAGLPGGVYLIYMSDGNTIMHYRIMLE